MFGLQSQREPQRQSLPQLQDLQAQAPRPHDVPPACGVQIGSSFVIGLSKK